MATDKTNVIVKIPLDLPHEQVARLGQHVAAELLRERDWKQPQGRKVTFKPKDYDDTAATPNIVEFRMTLTSDMTKGDLTDLALRFAGWLKDDDA